MIPVLLFGSSGFIGRHLKAALAATGVFDVKGYSSRDCDLLDENTTLKSLLSEGKDAVIILASAITRLRENSPSIIYRNLRMVENLCSAIKNQTIRHVVYLSTIDVYGFINEGETISEKTPCNPADNYAISKLASEFFLINDLKHHQIPLTIFRLPGVYGVGDTGKSTINTLVEAAYRLGEITVIGDGTDRRDFVYINDIAPIINDAVDRSIDGIFNLATGESMSILEMAQLICLEIGNGCRITFGRPTKPHGHRVRDLSFDTTLLKETFHECYLTRLSDGIKRYITESAKI